MASIQGWSLPTQELSERSPLCVGIEESCGRTISLMSRLTPVYTIYGLPYTTFSLCGRHAGQPVGSTVYGWGGHHNNFFLGSRAASCKHFHRHHPFPAALFLPWTLIKAGILTLIPFDFHT
jgi:hypothetical protein